jgi:hypothetical protein
MEDIKQLTIESVEVFRTGSNAKGPWTLYNVKANGEKYSTFLDLKPGETATFKIEVKPSDRMDRNGKPYMNRTIVGYTGSIDNMPAKPYRTSAEATAPTLTGLETRIKALELFTGINLMNEKADDQGDHPF